MRSIHVQYGAQTLKGLLQCCGQFGHRRTQLATYVHPIFEGLHSILHSISEWLHPIVHPIFELVPHSATSQLKSWLDHPKNNYFHCKYQQLVTLRKLGAKLGATIPKLAAELGAGLQKLGAKLGATMHPLVATPSRNCVPHWTQIECNLAQITDH